MKAQRLFRGPILWIILAFLGIALLIDYIGNANGYQAKPTSEVVALINSDTPLKSVTLVEGDETRQASVRQGIAAIRMKPELKGAHVVLVHDAVRPLVPATVVARVIGTIRGGAVAVAPAIPVADSIREETDDGRLVIVDRERLRAVQTPQGFDLDVLEASHDYADEQQIACTDDISVCEAAGHPVRLVKGAMTSLKITSATDLDLAHAFLKLRAGFGRHSFRRVLRHRPFAWVVKPAEPAPVIRSPE